MLVICLVEGLNVSRVFGSPPLMDHFLVCALPRRNYVRGLMVSRKVGEYYEITSEWCGIEPISR